MWLINFKNQLSICVCCIFFSFTNCQCREY